MTTPVAPPRKITAEEFREVSELLYRRSGITLVPGKELLVMGRLDKRLRELAMTSYREYLQLLRQPGHEDEIRHAIDLLTTNETYFFREPEHFEFLRRTARAAHPEDRPFRVWSAASSSGEEAYTAAMTLSEAESSRDFRRCCGRAALSSWASPRPSTGSRRSYAPASQPSTR